MKPTPARPLTIYYDASCPICATEMHALKAHDAEDQLVLVDCSGEGFEDAAAAAAGIGRADMMQAIHARTADGVWLKGVDVFVAAYEAAAMPWMAKLWGHPRLRPLWDRAYPWIARNRRWLSRLGAPHAMRALFAASARRRAARLALQTRRCEDYACAAPAARIDPMGDRK
jgi:predicted DCC family thiol-disulfide oxidoreductase YuxK